MVEQLQSIHVYLAPYLRSTGIACEEIDDVLRRKIRPLDVKIDGQLIIGNSALGQFDYALENLDPKTASRLVEAINELPGYAAKAFNWRA
jgi:hypothetical protein